MSLEVILRLLPCYFGILIWPLPGTLRDAIRLLFGCMLSVLKMLACFGFLHLQREGVALTLFAV